MRGVRWYGQDNDDVSLRPGSARLRRLRYALPRWREKAAGSVPTVKW